MRVGGIRIFVSELNRAREFYRVLLGAPLAVDEAAGFIVHDADGINVVIERADASLGFEAALVGRFTGVSFETDDIAADHQRLASAGILFTSEPELQPWGGWLATLQDPDGNQMQLVQYASTAAAPR